MIARLWSARASTTQCPHYLKHFSEEALPALRKFDGYVSSTVLTRPRDGAIEILVTTIWKSLESIDAFASPDRSAAVVAPAAAALLLTFDERVQHFDIALSDAP
jgi:heme-degrading monooxygenase HmoA